MRITTVIPSYNRHDTLPRALDSVFAQTRAVDEIILVDDGSSDDSVALVEQQYPDVKIIRQANQGVSAARNRGILAASGDWIALLDSDDSWMPHKIETLLEAATANPGYRLYHSDEIWIRRGQRVNPMRKHRKQGGWIFRHCLPLCAISPSAVLIHRPTLLELGLFDESLPACEDYDLWLRLCHRYPVHYTEQALITKYGGHDDQLSQQYPAMDRFRVRALHRLLDSQALGADDFAAAQETLHRKLQILVEGARKHGNAALLEEFEPLQRLWSAPARVTPC